MNIYSFGKETGKRITKFDSNFILARIVKAQNEAHIGFMFLDPGETIGFHQAAIAQLFLVIEGECWIKTGEQAPFKLKTSEAVMWESGEWHGTSTDKGVTALVIESEKLMPMDLFEFI